MLDVADLRPTIVPKSDQLNAEQLLAGPMTILIEDVAVTSSPDQPVSVHYLGEEGRPWKPCKTMRKLLVAAYGPDGRGWVGNMVQLYNDQSVKFGGAEVGGIRVAAASGLRSELRASLTTTRGKKSLYTVAVMHDARQDIKDAQTVTGLREAFKSAYKNAADAGQATIYKAEYDARLRELSASEDGVK